MRRRLHICVMRFLKGRGIGGIRSCASLQYGLKARERKAGIAWCGRIGAVATLLDLLFKPGVQVRILGGSLEQSAKMFEHLVGLCDRPAIRGVLAQAPTQRRVVTVHGSEAHVLAQSQRSVRGVRVHKLRCDEVEAFDPAVWEAAQLATRSGWCGEGEHCTWVRGRIEALSTMHRPFGMMSRLTGAGEQGGRRVMRWNYLDVIERCPSERPCESCVLWDDCGGRAKQANGFVRVDDLVRQWHRSSRDTWSAEMLCRRPRQDESVYPGFDPARHVAPAPADDASATWMMIGGMDFGLRSPTVMLWAKVTGQGERARVHVVDEYLERGRTLEEHLDAIGRQAAAANHAMPAWLGVDPAGRQRNNHTGLSDLEMLRRRGHGVRVRGSTIREGIERIRQRLDHGTLRIDPRCVRLIEAMQMYHFDPNRPGHDEPVKDGPDHACDALRYMIVNLDAAGRAVTVRQWA